MRSFSFQLPKPLIIIAQIVFIFFELVAIVIGRLCIETPKEIFIRIVLRIGVSKKQAKLLKKLIMVRKEECADNPYVSANSEMYMGAKAQEAGNECRRVNIPEWRIDWVFKI